MNASRLRFDPVGTVTCLHTEAIDLCRLGRLDVVRATDLRFSPDNQHWEVRRPEDDRLLFADPSRQACLNWEQLNLQPGIAGEISPALP